MDVLPGSSVLAPSDDVKVIMVLASSLGGEHNGRHSANYSWQFGNVLCYHTLLAKSSIHTVLRHNHV